MKTRLLPIISLMLGLVLFLAPAPGVADVDPPSRSPIPAPQRAADAPEGRVRIGPPDSGPQQSPEGLWFMPEGIRPSIPGEGKMPETTGGPDDFGYTWDDSVPLNWINATVGTDTGMSGDSWGQGIGPIPLPFAFKFYENTYSSVYIAASGYVAFTSSYWVDQQEIPSPRTPNNVVAPYWTPLYLNSSGPNGRVYYISGGTAPNRYFAVEWYNVRGGDPSDPIGGDDIFDFEVVLYENGDMVFQYAMMSYNSSYWCGAAGTEDSEGLDGLAYGSFCQQYASNRAVRYYRPPPSARVQVRPAFQGRFVRPGEIAAFQQRIKNTGEFGADTYDLFTASSWSVSLYASNCVTPLTDTDGDGIVDTGPVPQGAVIYICVKVQTPAGGVVGDDNSAVVTIRSSLNTNKQKTATFQTAIPAPFAQVFRDDADGAHSLYLVQPAGQSIRKVTPDWYYGYGRAIAEAPNGNFVYAWSKGRCLDSWCNIWVDEIEYTLLDRYGNTVRAVSRLTNNSGATIDIYEYAPAVAVAPNGRIGVLWSRQLWNSASQFNYNIYFAILDSTGNIVYGPANVTNNTVWGTWNDLNVPRFYDLRIAATGDNRFILAWERSHRDTTGWVYNIYYTVRDTNGAQVRGITALTGDNASYLHSMTAVPSNRVLLTWQRNWDIYHAVLDSSGNLVRPPTNLTNNGQARWSSDAVTLSGGRIAVAWTNYDGTFPDRDQLAFAILDSSYNLVAGPTPLNNPIARRSNDYISIAADANNHAILTWTDWDNFSLYYALVSSDGSVLTPPQIFRTSYPYNIQTSYDGYGNTSYSWTPPSGVDGMVAFSSDLYGGPPGGSAALSLRYANYGATLAANVVLTATLDSNLTYVGDTSGIPPTISGNNVVWRVPDLPLLESRSFVLYVRLPSSAPYGTRYPVVATLTSNGPEVNPSDNTDTTEVMAARQIFLPLTVR